MTQDDEISRLHSELTDAHAYSSTIVSAGDLARFNDDIASGDPKRIINAIARAKRLCSDYRADRGMGPGD